jgi:hypothetical protein
VLLQVLMHSIKLGTMYENSIGKFICLHDRSCQFMVTTVARVCVEVYFTDGLPDNIVIEAGKWCYNPWIILIYRLDACSATHTGI